MNGKPVIAIEHDQIFAGGMIDRIVSRGGDCAAFRCGDHFEPIVFFRLRLTDLERMIRGFLHIADHLEIAECLIPDRFECAGQKRFGLITGKDNGKNRIRTHDSLPSRIFRSKRF